MIGPILNAAAKVGSAIVTHYKPIVALGGTLAALIGVGSGERIEKAKAKADAIKADIEADVRKAEAAAGIEKAKIEADIEKMKLELAKLELEIKKAEAEAKK